MSIEKVVKRGLMVLLLVATVGIVYCEGPEGAEPKEQRPRIGNYNTDSLLKLYIALATVPDSLAFATRHAYMCYTTGETIRYGGNSFNYADTWLRDSLKRVGDIVQRADERVARNDPTDEGVGSRTCPGWPKIAEGDTQSISDSNGVRPSTKH